MTERKITINGENKIFGRIATTVAKYAMMGYAVDIVNCDKLVISGKKKVILNDFKEWYDKGNPLKGPYISRRPDFFVKRLLRNMLPHKKARGKEALARIKCYVGNKSDAKQFFDIPNSDSSKLPRAKFITIKEICKHLGAKV